MQCLKTHSTAYTVWKDLKNVWVWKIPTSGRWLPLGRERREWYWGEIRKGFSYGCAFYLRNKIPGENTLHLTTRSNMPGTIPRKSPWSSTSQSSSPDPKQALLWFLSPEVGFACSWSLFKWNHGIPLGLLWSPSRRLASFKTPSVFNRLAAG